MALVHSQQPPSHLVSFHLILSHSQHDICVSAQSQDGKVVSPGLSCQLSELMKRRLESVASTGSSASSGFIEDKSYCDSEEEEEGKKKKKKKPSMSYLLCPPPPASPLSAPCPSPLFVSLFHLPPLTFAPPLLHRNESSPQIVFGLSLMGHFLLLFSSTMTTEGATVTPLSRGRRLFISCADLSVDLFSDSSSAPACRPCCVISGLISCLLRWACGRTPSDPQPGP